MQNSIEFFKYQGTGNDFVMIDNRDLLFPHSADLIKNLCDRRFGIGGDGLILLENDNETDFKMVYYNSDGRESSMCGNGGRCIVAFAHFLDIFEAHTTFSAVDGKHEAEMQHGNVRLKMTDVTEIKILQNGYELNTGSPHYVQYVDMLKDYKVYENGNKIRNSPSYQEVGINVNFVEQTGTNEIFVRTYERGVEDETFSCGTGVTAAALVYMNAHGPATVGIQVLGGKLKVSAEKSGDTFHNIWLQGPAVQVFRGKINL